LGAALQADVKRADVASSIKHQKRSMDHLLEVSAKDTSVCIVDGTGEIVRELKVASEPEAL
jgi:hypothetical protein